MSLRGENPSPVPALIPRAGWGKAAGHDAECAIVINLIAKEKHVPARLLIHPSRGRRQAAGARQLAMYLIHVALGRKLADIGAIFGRDRTTVSHACALIEDRRDDVAFDRLVCGLELSIETALAARHEELRNGAR